MQGLTSRRALAALRWFVIVVAVGGCSVRCDCGSGPAVHDGADHSAGTRSPIDRIEWAFPDTPLGRLHAVVAVPAGAEKHERLPVLIALHGQGESRREPARGARGWIEDYRMPRALRRLFGPPLTADDFGGMVTAERLAEINGALDLRPYRGLVVVCPYLPDRFWGAGQLREARQYGDFLFERLLPRVRREVPSAGEKVGIDGVSLGGRAALLVGLSRPRELDAVGAMQPALGEGDIELMRSLASQARKKDPSLRLRLLSSDSDHFLRATRELSAAWRRAGLEHRLDVARGTHSYEFNRGPGVFEMLLYHDRALRGEEYVQRASFRTCGTAVSRARFFALSFAG
ncbi:MAG: alpha/beta hydrolase-fold protein [Polyangia bacterium]